MNIDDWLARYPWRNLCEACKGTGLRHDNGRLHLPRETCLDCLGDRLHAALVMKPTRPTKPRQEARYGGLLLLGA
jgi:hypothetical protein